MSWNTAGTWHITIQPQCNQRMKEIKLEFFFLFWRFIDLFHIVYSICILYIQFRKLDRFCSLIKKIFHGKKCLNYADRIQVKNHCWNTLDFLTIHYSREMGILLTLILLIDRTFVYSLTSAGFQTLGYTETRVSGMIWKVLQSSF